MDTIALRGLTMSVLLALGACGGGGDGSGDAVSLGGSGGDAITNGGGGSSGSPSSGSAPSGMPSDGTASTAAATWAVAFQEADATAVRQGLGRNGLLAFTAATGQGPRARLFDGQTVHELADVAATAVAVNDAGQVAGQFQMASNTELFRWEALTETTTNTRLGSPPDISSTARAINAAGVITGNESGRRNFPGSAIRWTPGSFLPQALAELDPAPLANSTGLFINTAGAVAGVSDAPEGQVHAAYWRAGETAVLDLGTLGGANSAPTDLNDAGQVAGQADDAQGNHRAFLWSEDTGMVDLGTLGGTAAMANDLNESGAVVGTADTAEGGSEAFLWTGGAMRSLGTLGGRASAASAINASGLVGGNSETSTGVQHAFVWSEELGMVDLNDRLSGASPGVLQTVIAVADDGTVLAQADGGTLVLLQPSGKLSRAARAARTS
jgi:probable HAF family extracellular repeat protein